MDEAEVARVVSEVLRRVEGAWTRDDSASPQPPPAVSPQPFVYESVESAVAAASAAQAAFQSLGLEQRAQIIRAMRKAGVRNAEPLAKMAREETGLGRWQDKVQKNLLVSLKTPGTEDLRAQAYTGDKGLTLVEYAPFGVVAAVTPSTNPAATVIGNAISILAGGNAVVFAPHPSARRCSREAMRVLGEAAVSAGAPPGLIVTVEPASQETVRALLEHPGPQVNLVTGGPGVVKLAMSVGKACKTIAAGPGNPPVVVDETALLPKAAEDIVTGASFDNGILCTAEKEVVVTRAAREGFLSALRGDPRAFELSASQTDQVTRLVLQEGGRDAGPRREFVGRDASVIAEAAGLRVPEAVRLLWAEVPDDHPLVWTEQLMPVLPVVCARDVEAAVELAYHAEGYRHHTASMHSMDVGNLTRMGRRMACSIFVKNAPTFFGLGMGEGYASMSIGTPTGDGLTKASHFVRPLQCSLVGYFRIA